MKNYVHPPHVNETADIGREKLDEILDEAMRIHVRKFTGTPEPELPLKNSLSLYLGLKPSARTAASIAMASARTGGGMFMPDSRSLIDPETNKERESLEDMTRCYDEMGYPIIFARVRTQDDLRRIMGATKHASVVNALCNEHHPLQSLADAEAFKISRSEIKKPKVVFMGDGNNVANSLGQVSTMLGWDFVHSGPEERKIRPENWSKLQRLAADHGGSAQYELDPEAAADGAHFVYADVFASMGEKHAKNHLDQVLAPYKVTDRIMNLADTRAVFGHCLPKGENEVDESVIYGDQSLAFPIAGCRMDTTAALIKTLMKDRTR